MSDIAKLGFSVDTADLLKGVKALDKFAAKGEQTEKRTDKSSQKIKKDYEAIEKAVGKTAAEVVRAEREIAKAQKESEKALAKRGRGIGQTSIQFQQFIGQVQGGQSVMVAFSQQAADIGIVLDRALLGSILGITASLIGMAFAFGSSGAEMVKASEVINSLIESYDKLSTAQKELTKDLLSNEIDKQSESLRKLKEEANDANVGFLSLFTSEKAAKEESDNFTASILKAELELGKLKSQLQGVVEEQGKFNAVWEEGVVRGGEFLTNLTHTANMAGKTAREMDLYKASILGASEAQLVAIGIQHDRIDAFNKEEAAQKTLQEEALEFGRTIAAEEKEFAAQQKKDKSDAEKARKKEVRDFDKLTKQINNFGGAWSKTGSVIVDAFGDISDAMNNYMDQLSEIESNEKALATFRKEKGEDNIEVIALQQKLESDRISAELSGLKSVAKAGESLFDEKTAAAKSFAALNKIIAIAEIALSFQKMTVGTTEAGVHVANETTKQGANALTAITSAFAAPFPVGFVAGAAMIGIMASLIGGFSGGGGSVDMTEQRQNTQGTGTALGSDEKSASILESQERFEDIQIDQLAELRGIRDSLNSVASGIALVTRDLIASRGLGEFGGDLSESGSGQSSIGKLLSGESFGLDIGGLGGKLVSSFFGSTKKKVTDSGIRFVSQSLGDILEGGILQADQFFDIEKTKKKFFGLSKKVSTSTEFESLDSSFGEGISAVFKNIGDVVLQSASLLGFETVTMITKSFSDIDPSDFDNINDFREAIRSGMGAVFTETEVGLEEALSKFQIDIGKVSLEGLSGEEVEAELQAIFSKQADLIAEFLVPSIAEYQKVGEGLFDTLTRVTQEQIIFNDNIKRMGFDLSGLSNVMQIDVAQSLIGLTGGLENFSDLSNSFIDEFFTDAEKFEMLETSISEAFDSLGLSMVGSKEEFRALIEGIDLTTESGQELFAALLEISPAFAEYLEQLESQAGGMAGLSEAAENAFSMLEKAVQLDKQRAAANLDIAREAHNAELSRIDDLRTALDAEQAIREQALLNSQDLLTRSFDAAEQAIQKEKERAAVVLSSAKDMLSAELNRISALKSALNEEKSLRESNLSTARSALDKAFNAEISRINDASKERIDSLNSEKSALESASNAMRSLVDSISSVVGSSVDLEDALSSARKGDFSKANQLDISGLSSLGSSGFSSAEELAVQEALNKNRLAAIGELAKNELTSTERMIASIDSQISATERASENEVAKLQGQLNTLLGIDDSVLSIEDAIKEFLAAEESLENLDFESELEALEALEKAAEDTFALHEKAYTDELERLDGIISDNKEQLNALLGIDTSVLSLDEAIKQFQEAQQAVVELGYQSEVERLDMLVDSANEVFSLHEQAYADEIERLDAMLTDNEELLDAALGINTSVLSVAEAITLLNGSITALAASNGNSIPSSPFAPVTNGNDKSSIQQEEIKEELKKTREDNVMFQREIVKNTKQTARILQRLDMNGIETRSEP